MKRIWDFFYAISLSLGAYIAIESLAKYNDTKNFIIFSFILLGIFLLEIFITWQRNVLVNNLRIDRDLIEYNLVYVSHKILLPILLYLSMVGYGYYNFHLLRMKLILFLSFGINFFLFVNIRAFFEHKTKTEKSTDFVFDVIKFLIFSTMVDVLYNFSIQQLPFEYGKPFFVISVLFLTVVLIELAVWRLSKHHFLSFYYSVATGVLNALLSLFFITFTNFNGLEFSILLTLCFYFYIAFFYHYVKQTLKYYIILEYIFVFLSIFAIFWGYRM
jgi:hypothetical protein